MPLACRGSFSRRWKTSWVSGSSATGCLPSRRTLRAAGAAAPRGAMASTSTVAGSSPSSPSSTALSLPCPLPVNPRLPNSSTLTLAVRVSSPSASRRSANRRAARIGPTVCELDGPIPILKMSNTEICTVYKAYRVLDGPARARPAGSQSEQDPGLDAGRQPGDPALDVLRDVLIEIHQQIPDVGIGRQHLSADVGVVIRDDPVDVAQHARDVAVDVEDAMRARLERQLHVREVDRAGRRAGGDILDQRRRPLAADRLLRLLGRPADVRREDDVGQPAQRGREAIAVG